MGLDERQEWLVIGVMRTRDSGPRGESNFECTVKALRAIDPEEEDFEVHRFGHWGPGWFELILVRPGSKVAEEAEGIENALMDYPIVDEEDCSQREWQAAAEAWARCSVRERLHLIRGANHGTKQNSIFAARREELPERDDQGYIFERLLRS
jgi:hypothetical protein